MADDGKGAKTGWSERELLSCLLNVVDKSGVTLNFKDIGYPPGRNANGFKQKINMLKKDLRPEWDAMAAGMPVPETTPKKPATPRKRKGKTDNDEGEADGEVTPKKPRGRPKKKVATPEIEDDMETIEHQVKDEQVKEELAEDES